jgi:hypothetical protein
VLDLDVPQPLKFLLADAAVVAINEAHGVEDSALAGRVPASGQFSSVREGNVREPDTRIAHQERPLVWPGAAGFGTTSGLKPLLPKGLP